MHTVRIATNCKLDIVGNLHLDHCGLVVNKLLDSQYDLVDIFPVYLLAVLETFCHVVDELLGHLVAELRTVVVWLNGHRSHIETIGGGPCLGHLDRGEEIELAHDLLTFDELELRILVAGIDLGARLEVLESILGSQDGSMGDGTAVVRLEKARLSVRSRRA